MFDTKDHAIIDTLQIEAEARRMRAAVFAAGIASLKAKLAALVQRADDHKAKA